MPAGTYRRAFFNTAVQRPLLSCTTSTAGAAAPGLGGLITGSRMYLTVEEDSYGCKQLYAHEKQPNCYHPVQFDHHDLVVLLDIMEMALAATPAVHMLGDLPPNTEHALADVGRREHEIVRHARKLLSNLRQERKDTLARQREAESRERAREVEQAQWRADRALWRTEREGFAAERAQWERDRARWQATPQETDHKEADHEGAGTDCATE